MTERLLFGSPIDGLLDRLYARNAAQSEAWRPTSRPVPPKARWIGTSSTSAPTTS